MSNKLTINPENGLLDPVLYRPSPHCDDRPFSVIDMIVIHGISLPPGEFESDAIEAFFCDQLDFALHEYFSTLKELKVSAHLLIKRSGKIIQFVPFTKRAWHAGESFFQGKTRCNDFSIGIELEGTDDIPYEDIQYKQLVSIINLLLKTYPAITEDRIVGHSEIAPGRKTDPGPLFNWGYLKGSLA